MTTRCVRYVTGTAALLIGALACSEDDSPRAPISTGGTGGASSGAAGVGSGGRPGGSGGSSGIGGSSGAGGVGMPDGGPAEFNAVLEGDAVRLTTSDNVWVELCAGRLRLVQRVGDAWMPLRDDRPDAHNLLHDAHYLDGAFHDACRLSLGCDVSACMAYSRGREPVDDRALVAREYVEVGQAAAPTCDLLDAGIDLDASSDAGVRLVPAIESRAPAGPIGVEIVYHLDSQCQTDAITAVVPVE